jgi:hypothetical protein
VKSKYASHEEEWKAVLADAQRRNSNFSVMCQSGQPRLYKSEIDDSIRLYANGTKYES